MVTRKPARTKAPESILVLRVDLAHLKPAIWRRLEVPADITLAQLHRVIQMDFDWYDSHLHCFEIGGRRYSQPMPDLFGMEMDDLDERKFRLNEVAAVGSRFTYTYDFGDDWHHLIKVEKSLRRRRACAIRAALPARMPPRRKTAAVRGAMRK